jgi:hypothetical protein
MTHHSKEPEMQTQQQTPARFGDHFREYMRISDALWQEARDAAAACEAARAPGSDAPLEAAWAARVGAPFQTPMARLDAAWDAIHAHQRKGY